ncbi:MAG: hypothetical protein QOK37_269 [Thermoanaerobaculia bacterium]|jgi:rRNA maturation endonuclease Nob1|nr:hypothetical protein [Thermoanaerobaculia bacterium]
MNALEKHLLRHLGVALMYVVAGPALVFEWVRKLRKELRTIEVIRSGILVCPYCARDNPLNRMATCARCRATEPGSVLRCSFCKAIFKTLTCDGCGATLRILSAS